MQKTIRLSINGTDLTFDVTTELYNKYVNEMMPNNKVAPAHNFAMRCVADGSREDLKSLLELPGAAIQIAGAGLALEGQVCRLYTSQIPLDVTD